MTREKEKYYCEICGRELNKRNFIYGKILCSKHMHQFMKYGKFIDNTQRTKKDLNDYKIIDDVVYMNLYNNANEYAATAIFDKEDLPKLKYHKWRYSYGRAVTGSYASVNKPKGVKFMHHLVMDFPQNDGKVIDHIDGNPLNNRKSNLRICTQLDNMHNKSFMSLNKSGVIGVSRDKRRKNKCWVAEIRCNDKKYHLGTYINLSEAAYARYIAEVKLFKEFRNTNKDEEKQKMFSNIPIEIKKRIENKVSEKISV